MAHEGVTGSAGDGGDPSIERSRYTHPRESFRSPKLRVKGALNVRFLATALNSHNLASTGDYQNLIG